MRKIIYDEITLIAPSNYYSIKLQYIIMQYKSYSSAIRDLKVRVNVKGQIIEEVSVSIFLSVLAKFFRFTK